ncbi:MAG: hypothetical protein AB1716_06175 [Planctomycetota bacterium]
MEPTPELIDALCLAKVRSARGMPPEEKFLAGAQLFDYACEIARAGIRAQHPDANEEQVEELLGQRLALGRRLEEQRDQR